MSQAELSESKLTHEIQCMQCDRRVCRRQLVAFSAPRPIHEEMAAQPSEARSRHAIYQPTFSTHSCSSSGRFHASFEDFFQKRISHWIGPFTPAANNSRLCLPSQPFPSVRGSSSP